jgi:pectin methylesterase-like acyl-CoA thioesterase
VSKAEEIISTTITVDLFGKGNFTSVQKAIDSIPSNNKLWTLIDIKAGIYRYYDLI